MHKWTLFVWYFIYNFFISARFHHWQTKHCPPARLLLSPSSPCRIRFAPQAGSFFPLGFLTQPVLAPLLFSLSFSSPWAPSHIFSATHVFYSFIFYSTSFILLHKPSHRVRPHTCWPPSCKGGPNPPVRLSS